MMIDWKDLLQQIMYVVITAALPIVLTYIKRVIDVNVEGTIANIENKNLAKYLSYAASSVGFAIDSVSQTYVDTLKKHGKFDEAAQAEAKDMAVALAKELISKDVQEAVETVYGDIDAYLSASIEAYLRASKKETSATKFIE